jgi:hypothetical protein
LPIRQFDGRRKCPTGDSKSPYQLRTKESADQHLELSPQQQQDLKKKKRAQVPTMVEVKSVLCQLLTPTQVDDDGHTAMIIR